MSLMHKVSRRHGFRVLLREKPLKRASTDRVNTTTGRWELTRAFINGTG